MATLGVQTTVGSVGPNSTPDLSTGNMFMVAQTPWGIDGVPQACSSMSVFQRLYGGLNKLLSVGTSAATEAWTFETNDVVVQAYYAAKCYYADKGPGSPGVLWMSRAIASSSGATAATGAFNDVTAANPTTITAKGKGSAGNTTRVVVANPSPRAVYTAGVGTVAGTSGAAAVTGTTTAFTAADVGKGISIGGFFYTIKTFASATSITVAPNLLSSPSGSAYGLSPPSCQVTVSFGRPNITEIWPIASAADALSASQKSELVTITLPGGGTLPGVAASTALTTGSDGTAAYSASDADYVGTTTAANVRTGMQVFNDQRYGVGYITAPGKYSATVRAGLVTHGLAYYRLAVMSSPSGLTNATVVADLGTTVGNIGTYYTPQVIVSDENSDTNGRLTVDNSGAICGLASRMIRDYNFGPHKSPAGKQHPLTSIIDIERQSNGGELYDDPSSNLLADSGVNTLRIKRGLVVWGLRTLATDRRWLQFNAAQTICQIVVTGQLILENYFSEPIDDQLFAQVTSDFKVLMLGLYRQGALYGDEPGQQAKSSDAFSIVCNRSNNPDTEIVNNSFKVEVAFVAKPNAETVKFNVYAAAPGFANRTA